MDKVDVFFELLSAVYGRAKIEAQWPTDRDVQVVKALVRDKVNGMELSEIRAAIDNARANKISELAGWSWPDVDLILAGSRRYTTAAHRPFLPAPARDILPPEDRHNAISNLRKELGL